MNSSSQTSFPESLHRSRRLEKVDPDGYKVVSVRLREGEFASFSEQTAAMGMTNNMALRVAARRIAGFLEIDPPTREALQAISDRIGDISNSIRRLSDDVRGQPNLDMANFASQRAAFGAEFIILDGLLRTLLNVSRRRTDGCALVSRAAE